jgi:fucose permease
VGFGGWVASVLLLEGLTTSPSQASYAVAVFWGAITLGRLAAVGLAALLPPRRLLLGQMALLSLGAILLAAALPSTSLSAATTAGAVFGAGMSSVFPTMLSLPADMGYRLDVQSTGHFLVASCLGEGLLPVAMGEAMHVLGTAAFPSCVLLGVGGMWLLVAALLLPRWLPCCWRRQGEEGGEGVLETMQGKSAEKADSVGGSIVAAAAAATNAAVVGAG